MTTDAETPANLSRQDIDRIADAVTMGDVQSAFEASLPDKAVAGHAFARAARRLGLVKNGTDPLDLVPAADVKYLGERMQASMSDRSPKSRSSAD